MNFYRKETSDDYQANTVTSFVSKKDLNFENMFFEFDGEVYANLKDNRDYKFKISDFFCCLLKNPVYRCHFEDAVKYAFYKYEKLVNR